MSWNCIYVCDKMILSNPLQETTYMNDPAIKDYLSQIGIRRISELDTALIEHFGQADGERHIERLTELFDQSEERLVSGTGNTPYLHRQEALVDYWNQHLQLSLLAASFYDRVFFRRVLEYLLQYDAFFAGDILDIGCGNGILTCFLALQHPGARVTGLDLSQNAVAVARQLSEHLRTANTHFTLPETVRNTGYDTLFSCRTVHENVAWKALCQEPKPALLSVGEHAKRHKPYAAKLAALTKAHGHLISVERYEDDNTYAGLLSALNHAGFCQIRGTHVQFSCKNGDGNATFQAMIFERNGA